MKQMKQLKTTILAIKAVVLLILILTFSCTDDESALDNNSAPTISDQSFNVSESANDDDLIGTVKASDAEKDELTFGIETNDEDLFEITDSGDLSLAPGQSLDFETKKSHAVTISVSDGKEQASATITLTVVDASENQAPVIDAQNFSVKEDLAAGSTIGTVIATDPDNDALTYTLTTDASITTKFVMDGNLIKLGNGESLDSDTAPSIDIALTVSDGTLSSSANMHLTVEDINDEAPEFIASGPYTAKEDVSDTHVIGVVSAKDKDSSFTFSLANDSNGLFEIGQFNGSITLVNGKELDFEVQTQHTIIVKVSDGVADVTTEVLINVTDVDDTPPGSITVSTFAGSITGSNDGVGTAAQFGSVSGITAGPSGKLYVTDASNNTIREVDIHSALVSTSAGNGNSGTTDGSISLASFNFPLDLFYNASNNSVYVADAGNHRVRKITITSSSGSVSTWAGSSRGYSDGNGASSQLNNPASVVVDASGNVYVADKFNHNIRRITTARNVSTFAGSIDAVTTNRRGFTDGTGMHAQFNMPSGLAIDGANNIYVADTDNHAIRKIEVSGKVTTIAGSIQGFLNGTGAGARFNRPTSIAIDASGNLYVVDSGNFRIRKVTPAGAVTTIAGTGTQAIENGSVNVASFNSPAGIAIGSDGNLYVGDQNATQQVIRKITIH